MVNSTPKSSIKIYKYNREIQHAYSEIRMKIEDETTTHQYAIRMSKDEPKQRYVTYEFDRRETSENILWYTIKSERTLPDETTQTTLHDIYITRKGYLVIAGMTDKETLLRYLANLLHLQRYRFIPRHFTKPEILQITEGLLEGDSNRIYAPRFHFLEKYKGREFTDFTVSETESAEDDPEYHEMRERCLYFEPVLKIQNINGQDFVSLMKLNRRGLIHSSRRMPFEDWMEFVKKYIPWCL